MKTLKKIAFLFCAVFSIGLSSQDKNNVTICWDVSLSMQDRDFERQFYFLDSYFKTIRNAEVTLLPFSNQILSQERYEVIDADWSKLNQKLEGFKYDGGTSYRELGNYSSGGEILLFTDGYQTMASSTPNFAGQLFVINDGKDFDKRSLNLLAIVNDGNLINLADREKQKAKDRNTIQYSGVIHKDAKRMANASLYIKGDTDNSTKTNNEGTFKINAAIGDTLVITFENQRFERRLDNESALNLYIDDKGIQLSEVVVEGNRIVEEEDTETITTAYGKEDKRRLGYQVQSIKGDEVLELATDAGNAVQGKFSGVRLGQNDDLSQVVMRGRNSIFGNNFGLIVVDGIPMKQSVSGGGTGVFRADPGFLANSDFLDPNNIAEVTVLKGYAATNRFGSLGVGGVLLITTKTAAGSLRSGERKDLALVQDNIYDGKVKVSSKTLVTPYLKELKTGKSVKEAYDIYLSQREKYSDRPEYFLDVYEFFHTSSPAIANRILSNVLEKRDPSYEELRGMYLKCTEKGNHELAHLAASKLVEFFPNKIQSYLDLAIAHRNSGNHQQALNLLDAIVNGEANPSLDFGKIEKIAGIELRNLVNHGTKPLDISNIDAKYRNNITYNGRLILEWNNPDAEFVVQFVNPQKRFFNWEHTVESNRERVTDGLRQGYHSEQFEIVGPETKGNWLLNVTFKGNRTTGNKAPVFLKCTVQYNFGKPDQQSKEFLVRLHELDEVYSLAKFAIE